MGFVEVAKEFRADKPEIGIELHDKHHDQVGLAVNDFDIKLKEEMANGQVVDTTQGPNEKRALSYLDGLLNFLLINDKKKEIIKAAKQALKNAKFQNLKQKVIS